jgi:ATP-dependent DNA helicase RecG
VLNERRRSLDLPFDQRTFSGLTLDHVELDRVRDEYLPRAVDAETLAENGRPLLHQLEALHLTDQNGTPNAALLLMYGRDPRARIPGAYLQFVRFDGVSDADPILDHKEINGTVPAIWRSAFDLIALNIRIRLDPTVAPHHERPDYPAAALRQIVGNALMHRAYEVAAPVRLYWYADRVEVESPGGLFGRVNESNFGERGATDYRNPALAAGLKVLGLVQTFGVGLSIARRACETNRNPPPSFDFGPSHVLCTLRAAPP